MHQCVKCKSLIKPASLAVFIKGEPHHPQCLSCKVCDKPLFGKAFKRNKDTTLQCENPCQPKPPQATSVAAAAAPPIANKSPAIDVEIYRKNNKNLKVEFDQTPREDDARRKTPMERYEELITEANTTVNAIPNSNKGNKICKLCNQPVFGRRFITYENGEIICSDCDIKSKVRPPRVKSAHIIICSFCGSAIQGRKYITGILFIFLNYINLCLNFTQ